MRVSIFTDASVGTLGVCGYAYYIGSREGKTVKSSYVKDLFVKSSDVGEMYCIGYALFAFIRMNFKQKLTAIDLYVDNTNCILRLLGIMGQMNDAYFDLALDASKDFLNDIFIKHGVKVNVKHVKSHTGNTDKVSLINDWCDKEAVRCRKEIEKQNKLKSKSKNTTRKT